MIDGKTKLYGIIGNPVAHSLSPAMHNRAFRELDINGVYLPFCVEDVENAVKGLKGLGISGASVTIPHKQAIMTYLEEISPIAQKIGAVNTLVMNPETGVMRGSNTDWIGANRALLQVTALKGKTVIILGSGGSARAIGFGLIEEGAEIVICSRTEKTGTALAVELTGRWYPLEALKTMSADILVNATSVGMKPNEDKSLVPRENVGQFPVVMDIVYAPLQTRLLKEAEEAGCKVVNGLEMLLYQGVTQFELWTGKTAPVEAMRQELMKATGNY